MFCTRCGTQLEETVRFCHNCGAATVNAPGAGAPGGSRRLVRSAADQKIAGVCAGFSHYFGVDITLVRILWIVLVIWPVPLVGIIAYIIAWIVMPLDTAPTAVTAPRTV
ncbi:MAG TPA: PspC domain-containing protein [Bryobacteraceae bacterium]|nr:PspC domain-containing protein [Bryobacteraceae bacterium]